MERRGSQVEWVVTTQRAPWRAQAAPPEAAEPAMPDVVVLGDRPRQAIEGFGACFNELGWDALSALSPESRAAIFRELFAPDGGARLTICRMPLGANDFSTDWYSYDEVPGDVALAHFSIANDLETLVPYIRSALAERPDLRLWASPWSPPTWMKANGHYAGAMPAPWQSVRNGLRPEQVGAEGTDMFILEEPYLRAYAAYFGRFIDAYRELGIEVGMVMPQNEFNSPQVFPSCTWTPAGLARFVAHLGPEMAARGVKVFAGTLERGDERLLQALLDDPEAGPHIAGAGFQWAGKGAIDGVRRSHPGLPLYQTEQECGDGKNDWRYCRYTWTLMRRFLGGGASAYMYWNIALREGGVSRWGWAQNSLVTVGGDGAFAYNHEYYLLKHLSHFVQPGARLLETISWTGYENQLAFANPDGSAVVVIQNDTCEEQPLRMQVGGRALTPTLPPDSFSTFLVRP